MVLHNPNANNPIPRHFFVDGAAVYLEAGKVATDSPPFHPFSSVTFVIAKEDPELDPINEARKSIRSLLKTEFDDLGTPKNPGADITGEEKEWFAISLYLIVNLPLRNIDVTSFHY